MKKLVLLLLCFMATSALAASPLRSGLYLGARLSGMRSELKVDNKKDHGNMYGFMGVVGARIRYFRVELEYLGTRPVKIKRREMETSWLAGQAYYDIPLKTKIRPFVNAGWGYHETKIKNKEHPYKETRKGSVWNLGGGLTWNTSNAANIDLGYRYVNLGNFKTPEGTLKPKTHMIYLGFRYVF
ncbi:MAG: porin family protein [Alphaproteobacteria bacterium]|nr:porin family protein [Alphaproteobacteria bacterium]